MRSKYSLIVSAVIVSVLEVVCDIFSVTGVRHIFPCAIVEIVFVLILVVLVVVVVPLCALVVVLRINLSKAGSILGVCIVLVVQLLVSVFPELIDPLNDPRLSVPLFAPSLFAIFFLLLSQSHSVPGNL